MKKLIRILLIGFAFVGLVGSSLLVFSIITSSNKDRRTKIDSDRVWSFVGQENPDRFLNVDMRICDLAQKRVDNLYENFENFSHDGFYEEAESFAKETGYRELKEIVGKGFVDDDGRDWARWLVDGWMESDEGHREVIIDDTLTHGCMRCKMNYCVGIFAK